MKAWFVLASALVLASTALATCATQALAADTVLVNPDNFVRAESDLYLGGVSKDYGFGKVGHTREPAPVDQQTVIRLNRDTLYSAGVFDLDAGPVTITLPDAGKRFMSLQVINEDHYVPAVIYKPGSYTFTKDDVGTRYMVTAFRTLVDPNDPEDVKKVHALQDAIKVEQPGGPGKLELPNWDQSQPEEGARRAVGARRDSA
jgi:hypothetical protein